MRKVSPRQVLIALAIAAVIYLMFNTTSNYSVQEGVFAPTGAAPGPSAEAAEAPACQMKAGTGLASSLLPREVASQEDFGEFAPEDVLEGHAHCDGLPQTRLCDSCHGAGRAREGERGVVHGQRDVHDGFR